jgi:diacylglycerol kinase family enzyme
MGSADRVVVVANTNARHLRRTPRLLDRLAAQLGERGELVATPDLAALDRLAASLAASPPAVLALLGGDGTLGRTLTAVVRAWPDAPLPPVAALGGGTMNTVSRGLGVRGTPRAVLAHVLRHASGMRPMGVERRSLLVVDDERMGFLFGNGLFARYIEAYEEGEPGPARAAAVLGRAVASALVGGAFANRLTRPFDARIEVDGELVAEGRWLVAAAGTVAGVGLGFRPFFGVRTHPGQLHALAIGCSPYALALQLHHTWRGRPMRHPAIHDRIGTELVVRSGHPQPYSLDGDLGRSGTVTRVRIGRTVDFLVAGAPPRLPGPR